MTLSPEEVVELAKSPIAFEFETVTAANDTATTDWQHSRTAVVATPEPCVTAGASLNRLTLDQQAMRHSRMELTMNVYTDPRLLDVHGAVNKLPAMNPVAPDEDEPVTVGGSEESESNMPPSPSQTESSGVTSSQRDGNSELPKKEEKPRQNIVLTGLSSVDDIGTSSMSTRRSSQLS